MDLVEQAIRNNFDIVYFVYGLAFIIMGLAVLFQTNKASELRIAKIFWLLSAFGIIHGTLEWLSMWSFIKGTDLKPLELFTEVLSFAFLFEFGRRLLLMASRTNAAKKFHAIAFLGGNLIWVLIAAIFAISFVSSDFTRTGDVVTRYVLAFPGCLITGFALFLYYKRDAVILLKLNNYFIFAGIVFIIYGILAGVVVKNAAFFPSSVINEDSFRSSLLVPVQLFRTVCAVAITVTVSIILKVFNDEKIVDKQIILDTIRRANDELRQLTRELREKTLQLEASNGKLLKLDKLKSEFLVMTSHELKGPLTAIKGFAGTLMNLELPEENKRHYLEIIDAEATRLSRLLDEYLDISMIEAGITPMPKVPANLYIIINETIESFKMSHDMRIEVNFPEKLPSIMANKDKIRQVVINLLENAVKYSPKNGNIIISGKETTDGQVICIKDEGLGIKNDDLNKLYEKFYRSEEVSSLGIKGFGLGLAIAKGIIEAHNGKIWVESEVGKGSSFYFSISKI